LKQYKPFLEHIAEEIKYLIHNSQALAYETFVYNETLKRSFVRALEVIGEATKNLPPEFRKKYPEVQWKELAGLRDILIHQYFGIDYRSVWDVVKNKVPKLQEYIESILKEMNL
jgi:uncharacterized protein with HEPN domain